MLFHAVTQTAKGTRLRIVPSASAKRPRPGDLNEHVGDVQWVPASPKGASTAAPPTLKVSVGPAAAVTPEILRRAGGTTARWLVDHHVDRAVLDTSEIDALSDQPAADFCEGLALGLFRFRNHRTDKTTARTPRVDVLTDTRRRASVAKKLGEVVAICDAVNLAREWAHEPANVINPVTLASRLQELARDVNIKCTVYDEKQLARMKAGAILAVGKASETPSRLIVLEYGGATRGKKVAPVVLVGKAITFDTGGYSLKDKEGIVGMKYDKCGATAVIGAIQAAAALKIKTPVVGVIASAENMIAGNAYRPNDIITTLSGKTVEIISTDAEGRLVLADALTYAQQHYKPRAMINLATLTGGVVVALGDVRAGLFSNHDALVESLVQAGEETYERLWRLPLDKEYVQYIKGDDSDLKNSGGRKAHPIIGGIFLKQFVDDKVPWAHLDIAGVADVEKDMAYCPKGATGFGVRLLVRYLQGL